MKKQKNYPGSLRWAIYGMSVAGLFMITIAAYLIVRITDGNWANWELLACLVIGFIVTTAIGAMFTAIPEIKKEIDRENAERCRDCEAEIVKADEVKPKVKK